MAKKGEKPENDFLLFVLVATAAIAGIVIMILSGTNANNVNFEEDYNLGGQAMMSCNECVDWCNGQTTPSTCYSFCVRYGHCARNGNIA